MTSIAEAIAHELEQAGVDRAFGLPGGEVLHLIEALRQRNIVFTLCRHEANAGTAAAVYGKLRGVPGVAITTLGPGAANLMLPLSNSLLDREPLLAISAQIPNSWPATHTHQRIPLLESYGPVTKFAAAVNRYSARRAVRQAIQACLQEPAGPAYLTVSAEDAVAPAYEAELANATPPQTLSHPTGSLISTDPADAAEQLRERLASAERPLVLLGIGVPFGLATGLRQWLDAWDLPVAVTPKVKGLVDETRANFVGVIGGMAIDSLMLEALNQADLLISFGFDPVEVDKTWHDELPILWVLESPLAMDVVPRRDLIAVEYKPLLDRLASMEAPKSWTDSFTDVKDRRRDFYVPETVPDDMPLRKNPVAIVRALAELLPPETIVTTDVGTHKYLFGQFWPSREPGTFFMSNGLSGMGYGLPAAIGAKLARPDVPVLAVLGDGGFSMNSQELETARRAGAPIIVLVLADKALSLIRLGQESRGLPNYGVEFQPIDSVGTAEACGVEGVRAESAAQLRRAVDQAVSEARSLVVEVPIDIDAYRPIV